MVGEIRDRETAEIAMAAAVTGHMVLFMIQSTWRPNAAEFAYFIEIPLTSADFSANSADFRRFSGHSWDTVALRLGSCTASRSGST